jgi:hypothetical protein
VHSLKACRQTRDFVSGGTPLGIVRQGSKNEELPSSIVSWNGNSCVALTNMQRLDLVLGSATLAVLFAVMISGIIYSVV